MGKNKVDIHHEIKVALRKMESFGESKFKAKEAFRDTHEKGEHIRLDGKIYSYSTARAYNHECQKFAEYVREVSPTGRYTTLEDARQYAKDYIQMNNANKSLSPYTVKLQASALSKLYSCSTSEWGPTRSRLRADIKRGRNRTVISEKTGKEIKNPSTRAGHFSEKKHKDIVDFARGTGLRRIELTSLRGNQLFERNGQYYLHIEGKGGRSRDALIRGDHAKEIIARCKNAGNNKVWEKVPGNMDVHHYRALYAEDRYKELTRDIRDTPHQERYYCRADKDGIIYDKNAMGDVSQSLGHNREEVIASHYLLDD